LSLPARAPKEIVHRLDVEINRAMAPPEVTEKMVTMEMAIVAEPPKYFEDPCGRCIYVCKTF